MNILQFHSSFKKIINNILAPRAFQLYIPNTFWSWITLTILQKKKQIKLRTKMKQYHKYVATPTLNFVKRNSYFQGQPSLQRNNKGIFLFFSSHLPYLCPFNQYLPLIMKCFYAGFELGGSQVMALHISYSCFFSLFTLIGGGDLIYRDKTCQSCFSDINVLEKLTI